MSIVIRFVKHATIASDAIALFQKDGWATHAEAQMPDGSGFLGAQLQGVVVEPVGYDKGDVLREQLVTLTDATPEQADKFYTFLHEQLGKPYDYVAIAGVALGRDWREGKSWFCSELVAAALEHADYWKLASDTNHVTPRDLYLVVSGRIAFKGK